MAETKKATTRKTTTRKAPAKKATTTRRAAAKKPAARKAPAKKPAAKTDTELFGGAKNVKIETVEMTSRNYSKRALMPEDYPFSEIDNAEKLGDGTIRGQSFFIPDSDDPQKHLARARKQLKEEGKMFWSRKDFLKNDDGEMIPGLRVWRQSKQDEADYAAGKR